MKTIKDMIKKMIENLRDYYLNAMSVYGDAINNSRGLVGA